MFGIVVLLASFFAFVSGHGRLIDPPNRSSMWRYDRSYPANYNDNQNFCGGFYRQYSLNEGKCGVCGDDYRTPHPQPNENTGKFGIGRITATYQAGSVIDVISLITANHLGNIRYSICRIDDSSKPETGEDCFIPVKFANGRDQFDILKKHKEVKSQLQLPKGFRCKHCTLRWTYTAGNNWGVCEDGTGKIGCGNQETFRSCADVAIV